MKSEIRYLLIVIAGLLTGFLIGKIWVLVTVGMLQLDGNQKIQGYHFHHNLLSIIPVILLFFVKNRQWLIFLGALIIGIILEHRVTYGGFYFITPLTGH